MVSKSSRAGIPTHQESHELPAPAGRILVLSILSLGAGIALTMYLARASYHSYTGYLQAKSRVVISGADSRIARVFAAQGESVRPGTPLFALKDLPLEGQIAGKRREVAALQAELAQVHAKAGIELSVAKQRIEADIFEVKLKAVQYQKAQLANQRSNLTENREPDPVSRLTVRKNPFQQVSAIEERKSRHTVVLATRTSEGEGDSLALADAQVELCKERLAKLERNLTELPAKILEAMGADVVQARLDRATDELDRLERQEQALNVTAEVYGTVGVYRRSVGDHVSANEPIVELLDEDQPYLIVQIPAARLVDFAPGTVIELHFPGGIVGEGKVEEIPPQVAPLPRTEGRLVEEDALITVHVAPSGALWPELPFGSTIEVRR